MTQLPEEAPFRARLAGEPGGSGEIRFALRAGSLRRYPDPVSLRVPVSRFVVA